MSPNEQQQMPQIDLSNYAKRIENGDLSWKKNNQGQVVLVIKNYNSAREEVQASEVVFSSIGVSQVRNQRSQDVLTKRQQILTIEQEIADIEREDAILYQPIYDQVVQIERDAVAEKPVLASAAKIHTVPPKEDANATKPSQ